MFCLYKTYRSKNGLNLQRKIHTVSCTKRFIIALLSSNILLLVCAMNKMRAFLDSGTPTLQKKVQLLTLTSCSLINKMTLGKKNTLGTLKIRFS